MAFNGSGTFNQATAAVVSGTVISSTNYNTQNADFATGLSTAVCKDGQTTLTANIPFAGFKITGYGSSSTPNARTDVPSVGQVQDGSFIWCGTAEGTADALTLTPTPAITAYATGQKFRFISGASPSSSTVTLAVSGLTAKAAQMDGAAFSASVVIEAGKPYEALYDGTQFQLQKFSASTSIADGSITNAKLANVATATFKGRTTAGTGVPEDLTAGQATALLNAMVGDSGSGGTKGLVPAPAAGDAAALKFLKADSTWAAPTSGPTNGTAVATTSGTAIQFTGIPSTVKRIIVSFAYVSTNGSSNLLLQIGPSGGVETSGYDSYTAVDIGTTNAKVNSTAGHVLQLSNAARQLTGQFILTLLDSSGNKWLISHFCQDHGSQAMQLGSSYKALSGTLERLRLTSVSGDTFDNGNMNIMYD